MAFGVGRPPDKPEPPDYHYTLDLRPDEIRALLDSVDGRTLGAAMANRLTTLLRDASRRDGPPLPQASLPWAEAERRARERGESVPEYIFDVARGKDGS